MPIIAIPRQLGLRTVNWRQPSPAILNRSIFTGRTRDIRLGPAARWLCDAEQVDHGLDLAVTLRGFLAQMNLPGNFCRLQASEGSQHGAAETLLNTDLASGANWTLTGAASIITSNIAVDPAPAYFRFIGGTPRPRADHARITCAASTRYFLSLFTSRDTGATLVDGFVVNLTWRRADNSVTRTDTFDCNPTTAGAWRFFATSYTSPADAVAVDVQVFCGGATGNNASATAPRFSALPGQAAAAAGGAGYSLPLSGLATGLNLPAGELITVTLPAGDEQLIALAADLTGDGSGNGTASLATPLRATPAVSASVELARPWALMRLGDPIAWGVAPGLVHSLPTLRFEEAF